MNWTNRELSMIGIVNKIERQADIIACELIVNKEGYDIPIQLIDRNGKDYKHYFEVVKGNIINNMHVDINEKIRTEYREHMERMSDRMNKIKDNSGRYEMMQVS